MLMKPLNLQNLKFTEDKYTTLEFPYGGGHTCETNPMNKGWQIKKMHERIYLVARPDHKACFSISLHDEFFDVAYYPDHTGREVFKMIKERKNYVDVVFYAIPRPATPGWMLGMLLQAENGMEDIQGVQTTFHYLGERATKAMDDMLGAFATVAIAHVLGKVGSTVDEEALRQAARN